MVTLTLQQGLAIVGDQRIHLDGSIVSILRLALALAEGGPFRGRAGEASTEARLARGCGWAMEARSTEFAIRIWTIAWSFTEKSACPISDHMVQSATFGLLRLGDSIKDRALWQKAVGNERQWRSTPVTSAITDAIKGSRDWLADADGGDTSRDAVLGLPEDRQWYLHDHALPNLERALTTLREGAEQLIVEAYERGRRDGSNVLSRLATGDASTADFDGVRK